MFKKKKNSNSTVDVVKNDKVEDEKKEVVYKYNYDFSGLRPGRRLIKYNTNGTYQIVRVLEVADDASYIKIAYYKYSNYQANQNAIIVYNKTDIELCSDKKKLYTYEQHDMKVEYVREHLDEASWDEWEKIYDVLTEDERDDTDSEIDDMGDANW